MTESELITAFNMPWRHSIENNEPFKHATRPAAVLIAINPIEKNLNSNENFSKNESDAFEVLFTTRASHLKHHAGQVSFPGGKAEETDPDLAFTARREAHEEIGLSPEIVNIIGAMPNYRTISGFSVTPVLGMLSQPIDVSSELILDMNEVDDAFSVPLPYLLNLDNYYIHNVKRGSHSYPIYFIRYQEKTIWGATAGMLVRLANHLSNNTPLISKM